MKKTIPEESVLIPDNADKVFTGKIFDIYQWPQTMFDGSVQTFEMLKRPDTIQVIVVRDGKLLLVEDEQPGRPPRLHLPGGRAEEADGGWLNAAVRELREETGLVCDDLRLIDVIQPEIKLEWFGAIFLATEIISTQRQRLDRGGEKIRLVWRDYAEVRRQVLSGEIASMRYMAHFFNRVADVEQLITLPAYAGQEVDR